MASSSEYSTEVYNGLSSPYPVATHHNNDGSDVQHVDAEQLSKRMEEVGGGVTYFGDAQPGTATSAACWRIKKVTETSTTLVIEWASGSNHFNQIWDNRLSLSYS